MHESAFDPKAVDPRQRFARDLPFYVNGTLDASDRQWMDDYLVSNPEDVYDLQLAQATRRMVQSTASDLPEDVRLERLLSAWRRERAESNGPEKRSGTGGALPSWMFAIHHWWTASWTNPRPWVAAAAMVVLVQAIIIGMLWPNDVDQQAYRGVDSSRPVCATGPGWRIVLDPAAPHAEVVLLLRRAGVQLVHGPSESGEIWIKLGNGTDVVAAGLQLKASPLVEELVPLTSEREALCP
jgi:hypothetical protein